MERIIADYRLTRGKRHAGDPFPKSRRAGDLICQRRGWKDRRDASLADGLGAGGDDEENVKDVMARGNPD